MALSDQIQACVDRMERAEAQRWNRETLPRAARIERGSFYVRGPICLVAYDVDGIRIQTVSESSVR